MGFTFSAAGPFLPACTSKLTRWPSYSVFESTGLDGAVMYEYIAAFILFNEPEALLFVKPLNLTFRHRLHPPFFNILNESDQHDDRKKTATKTPKSMVAYLCTSKCPYPTYLPPQWAYLYPYIAELPQNQGLFSVFPRLPSPQQQSAGFQTDASFSICPRYSCSNDLSTFPALR